MQFVLTAATDEPMKPQPCQQSAADPEDDPPLAPTGKTNRKQREDDSEELVIIRFMTQSKLLKTD